ncbi:MAG TPA: hypothetical protein VFN97_29220 [Actinospica sp.]|nr:hypothetical protein [Actinospica sp.]
MTEMAITDEIRKTLSDPKPLYALAGAGDLAAEKIKEAPEHFKDAPALIAEAGATLTTIANKIAAAPQWREPVEALAKAGATVQGVATKGLRPDGQAIRGAAQTVALQQVGRLLEAAGKAVETYDELAERGKVVVLRYSGSADTVPGEAADAEHGAVKVVVEQVVEEDEIEDAPVESAAEAAQVFEEAAETETAAEAAEAFESADEAPKPAAARKAATAKKAAPRKRATAPKTPRPPKA